MSTMTFVNSVSLSYISHIEISSFIKLLIFKNFGTKTCFSKMLHLCWVTQEEDLLSTIIWLIAVQRESL